MHVEAKTSVRHAEQNYRGTKMAWELLFNMVLFVVLCLSAAFACGVFIGLTICWFFEKEDEDGSI